MDQLSFDLAAIPFHDPNFYSTPRDEYYRVLRDQHPLYRHEPDDPDYCAFWIASTFEHVQKIAQNPRQFSSARFLALNDLHRQFRDAGTSLFRLNDPPGSVNLIFADPPVHSTYRGVVGRHFSPGAVKKIEQVARSIVADVMDSVPLNQPVDAVTALTAPIPSTVIAQMLGIPREDIPTIRKWLDAAIACSEELTPEKVRELQEGMTSLWTYLLDLIRHRRVHPGGDLISVLATAAVGAGLSDVDTAMLCRAILFGGNETVRHTTTGALIELATHPEQFEWLRADTRRIGAAVEEILRICSPSVGQLRVATEDVEVAGHTIAEGEPVWLVWHSANRDSSIWPNAEQFDITRPTPSPPHITFSSGPHFCLGSHLARLELRIILEELLKRFSKIEYLGNCRKTASSLVIGIVRADFAFAAN